MCRPNQRKLCGKSHEECPMCFDRSYAAKFDPDKVKYWSKKNLFDPHAITCGSSQVVFHDCPNCPHTFGAQMFNITGPNKQWCPYCCDMKICGEEDCDYCVAKSYSANANEHQISCWSDTNVLKPYQVFWGSSIKYDHDCPICNHTFQMSPVEISLGYWCQYCSHHQFCEEDDCDFCFNITYASFDPKKVACWNKSNPEIPRHVLKGSNKKYLHDCDKCPHTFESRPATITGKNCWCPYCANFKLCGKKECKYCFAKSYAAHATPKQVKSWGKNKLLPYQVIAGSITKYSHNCPDCGHTFLAKPYEICKRGAWCPYCIKRKMCFKENCQMCFDMSYASFDPEKVACWFNNKVTPRQVFKCTDAKYNHKCAECEGVFSAALHHVVGDGQWCPYCKNKTELIIYKYLCSIFGEDDIVRQPKFDWCKYKRRLPFDFYIKSIKTLVECDGKQHFIEVKYFKTNTLEERFQRDIYKMEKALENNYKMIRICQEDVFFKTFDWKKAFTKCVETFDEHDVFFISNDEKKFDKHKSGMIEKVPTIKTMKNKRSVPKKPSVDKKTSRTLVKTTVKTPAKKKTSKVAVKKTLETSTKKKTTVKTPAKKKTSKVALETSTKKKSSEMPNYKDKVVKILREILGVRGLKKSGRKAELITRLEEYDKKTEK